MCEHEWEVKPLAKNYVWLECEKCHDSLAVTATGLIYDFGDEHGETSTWGKHFASIKESYKLADQILAGSR